MGRRVGSAVLAAAVTGLLAWGCSTGAAQEVAEAPDYDLPVRGLHVSAWSGRDVDLWERFIRDALPREGVNVLILSVGFNYDYQSQPKLADPEGLTAESVARLRAACDDVGVKLIPQINLLGHQSWRQNKGALLTAFPEFDETPWIPDESRDLYCRSYCPLHPDVHDVVFDVMDELADAFDATDFHLGMDEVFFLAEEKCVRCGGKDPAKLFGDEVTLLRDHLAESGRTAWLWGDRFIDGEATGIGKWEAATNGTAPSVDAVPKDIIICDWHYNREPGTAAFFLEKGFQVVYCPWRKGDVALEQRATMRELRKTNDRALGMVQTTWCGFTTFVKAYYGELDGEGRGNRNAIEAAECFKLLGTRGTVFQMFGQLGAQFRRELVIVIC